MVFFVLTPLMTQNCRIGAERFASPFVVWGQRAIGLGLKSSQRSSGMRCWPRALCVVAEDRHHGWLGGKGFIDGPLEHFVADGGVLLRKKRLVY